MLYSLHILDFLDPVNTREISNDEEYKDGQVGKLIEAMKKNFPTCPGPTWSWSVVGKNGAPAVPGH